MTGAAAGHPWVLYLDFYDEVSGVLTDPTGVQLDITYGGIVGAVPDVAGPVTYQGAGSSVPGQVWRISAGQYAFTWDIPPLTQSGVYTANWTCTYGPDEFLGVENFNVSGIPGGYTPPVPAGDTGFWTGGLIYGAAGLDIEFGQVDDNGIAWLWQKLDGWDGPDVQGSGVIARSGDHGAWASPQYYAARTMTLTVTASAPTQALRDTARALLQQAVPVSDLAMLRYDEPTPKFSWIRRSGRVTEAYPTLADVTFTVGLVAPDPRKYAVSQRSLTIGLVPPPAGGGMVVPFTIPVTLDAASPPGAAVATNAGNFETPPVVVITGPVQQPSITNLTTGLTVSWSSLSLGTGDTLVVDCLNRQAFVNPTTVSAYAGIPSAGGTYWPADVSSAWWQINPGDNELQYGGIAGSGSTAAFTWQDAWI
jgi:hypothetical protein